VIGIGMLERYVLRKTLASLGAALAVLGALVMLIAFVDITRNVGTRSEDAGFGQLLYLTVLQAPATLLTLTPFIFLFGTLGAFVGLNRRSELIAMRAAGVSAWRFILPAAFAAFAMGIVTVTLLNPLTSAMSARFETERDALLAGYLKNTPKGAWLRQGDDKRQIVIRARMRDMVDGAVRLRGVSFFVYDVKPDGSLVFTRRYEAAEARLEPGFWRLTGVSEATPGAGALRSESASVPSDLDERTAADRFKNPQAVAFWRLPETITRTEAAGFSATPFKMRLQQMLATPLLFAAMSILAAAFSLRLMRLGGLAALAGSGVALGFGFFFFNELCGALGKADVLGPILAAWTPPVAALLAGLTLLCYTEDG
jgi:lipopolysaccharide export system permease protein